MDRLIIAAKLIAGWLGSYGPEEDFPGEMYHEEMVKRAYGLADKLIAANQKTSEVKENLQNDIQQLKAKIADLLKWFDGEHTVKRGKVVDKFIREVRQLSAN